MCATNVSESPKSLMCYKLPETGSTWFAQLLNDFSETVAVQHQWIKESHETGPSSTLADRRKEFLRLSLRCPTRRGTCYGDGKEENVRSCLVHDKAASAKKNLYGQCAVGERPGAAVRGMTMNPVVLRRANATADALCRDLRASPDRERLLVAYYRANVVKSALSHILKHLVKAKGAACTKCGQVMRDSKACVVEALLNGAQIVDLNRKVSTDRWIVVKVIAFGEIRLRADHM